MQTRRTVIVASAILAAGCVTPAAAYAAPTSANPVVELTSGKARGSWSGPHAGIRVRQFLGIPCGADTRATRFLPPKPVQAWKGIRDATAYGPASPQGATGEAQSEDCLVLNLWAPEHRTNAKRAVLVYIHGGGYTTGSGASPLTHGARLAARGDVVVITLNHRLNLFGHLHLAALAGDAYAASGNAGLLDLVLALQWVRDNAAAFGGDEDNVTLFCQSGGGAKIACLMAMPAAAGLFHRIWTMSGHQVTLQGPRGATTRARAAMEHLGASLDQLRDLSADKLLAALNARDPSIANTASRRDRSATACPRPST